MKGSKNEKLSLNIVVPFIIINVAQIAGIMASYDIRFGTFFDYNDSSKINTEGYYYGESSIGYRRIQRYR